MFFFFFKQKTAYEMRISDWSSDVCSSDLKLRVGSPYNRESLDLALKDLFATELFSDVQIRDDQGNLTIEIKENPVINRIVLEGNKRLKDEKIQPEIKLAPRQIFTRSKVRADEIGRATGRERGCQYGEI